MRAHEKVFAGGDVEKGESTDEVKGLLVVDGVGLDMDGIVETVCQRIYDYSTM